MDIRPLATINLSHLRQNLEYVGSLGGHVSVMAVIKADAYGHGMAECIAGLDAADGFAVARLEEALELRAMNEDKRILILGGVYSPLEISICKKNRFDIVVHSDEQVKCLTSINTHDNEEQINLWIKLDSGMHRLGFDPDSYTHQFQKLSALPFVENCIAMTHFSDAESSTKDKTARQMSVFDSACDALSSKGLSFQTSLANSAAIMNIPSAMGDWIRPGLMLYGINPLHGLPEAENHQGKLKPVMTLEASVIAVKDIQAGESVGYCERWTAPRDSTIAIVACGYGDGYPVTLSEGAPVWLADQKLPVVGRVSMDYLAVDCTGINNVKPGDKVELWGEHLSVSEVADCAGTIPYDLVCKLTPRVKRRTIS
jgi:alanine racemase